MDARGGNEHARSPIPSPQRPDEIGIIRATGPAGEEDFTGHRYWVEAQFCANDAGDETEALASREYPAGHRKAVYAMMTNIAEPEDEHNLEPGTRVRWNYTLDRSTPQQRKYYFALSAAAAIIAAGHFNALGSQHVESVAAWNGRHWRAFRSMTAPDGTSWDVRDGLIYHGELYICGRQIALPDYGSGSQIVAVARWNGTDWVALGGSGTSADSGGLSVAHRLCLWNGKLVAVGDGVAAFDGSAWSTVGSGGPSGGDCWDAAVYLGDLHVVGEFSSPGAGWAKFDGAGWSAVSTGLRDEWGSPRYGYCLHVDGDDLYVGGQFAIFCGVTDAINVGKWTNGTPSRLGTGMPGGGSVKALCTHQNLEGRYLYGCGNDVLGNPLARFTGTTWQPVGAQLYAAGGFTRGSGLCEFDGELIMAGSFDAEMEVQFSAGMSRVARSELPGSDAFVDLGIGVNAAVRALAIFGGDLHAAGAFTQAKQTDGSIIEAHRLAAYSESSGLWRQVLAAGDQIRALAIFGGRLIAGGDFTAAAGLSASHLVRWDGAVADTFGGTNGPVHCLHVDGGTLNIGGEFTFHGGAPIVPGNGILWWNGAAWGSYGEGFTYSAGNVIVRAIIRYGGDLYACGRFDGANAGGATACNFIARWDGAAWQMLGSGLDGEAYCLFEYAGALWVGGDFQHAGGVYTPYLARWNGSTWSAAGVSCFRPVEALHVFDGKLWAGGTDATGGIGRVFTYDGSSWAELNESFRGRILAITSGDAGAGDHPYVGGDFNRLGDTTTDAEAPANRVMRYGEDGLQNVGGGVGVTPNFWLGIDGGAGYACRTLVHGDETLLFVFGRFTSASDVIAESYGRRLRRGWRPLGRGLRGDFGPFIRQVRHAVKFDDGGGPATIVCGAFSKAVNVGRDGGLSTVTAACCARFRDGQWTGGMDLDSLGMALCVHAFPQNHAAVLDDGNRVTAAPGTFVARLRGTRLVVSAGANAGTYVIGEVISDTQARIQGAWPGNLPDSVTITLRRPDLYCTGWFSSPDRIARWNVEDEVWEAVGDLRAANGGSDFIGWTLCSFADKLWVGIQGAGGVFAWDGATWTTHFPGDAGNIHHLLVADLGDGETIYAAVSPSSGAYATVRKLDPFLLTWSDVGPNTGEMKRLAVLAADTRADAPEPRRLVAFNGIDIGGTTYNVAEWDGAAWKALGSIGGLDLAESLICLGPQTVIIGGLVSEVDGRLVSYVAELRDEWGEPRMGGANGDVLYLGR